ncbi:hypothetical protein M9R32_01665 [Paenisporosarcina quisquiliarum]|uniref:Uncharacterized protein n=1 Tax=Paenisporosarcina quisquiliarum TaxID=365346 RepID=A0A9X3LDB3_9BACL|nr:hypothetical protein [Paenisporosarcina quisquiliarum]MCZ8535895.1 hypothetical protein [Paenisporosarcina quisquiliarum]
MKLIQWSYTKRYQVKAIFDEFPDMILIFRTIGSYYFVFTTKGSIVNRYPTRKDYVEMELLINEELQTLPAYINRKSSLEMKWVEAWLRKKELPLNQLEVLPYKE